MAILEESKYYNHLLLQYISTRFGILKFASFAVLLTILGLTEFQEWKVFAGNCTFIFASLFAFRVLDDAWSSHLDRIYHPQRTYSLPGNFKPFILFSILVFIVYQAGLFLFSLTLAITMLSLLVVSTALYSMFFRSKNIMTIIPLLKYPVLIWCISSFSMSPAVFLLSAGAFFMMLTSDLIDEKKLKTVHRILLILITGILIFQPWVNGFILFPGFVLIAIPLFFSAFTSMKNEPIFTVIIFPVLHLFDLIISI